MPALKNQKHEQFCQLIPQGAKNGWTQGEIYQRSGFRASGHSAEVAASRLLKRDDIRQRLEELAAPAVKRTKTTLDSLIGQFDEVFDGAMGDKQFGAAGSAATVKAKLTGFLRDKLEVGAPGDFSNMESAEEVLEHLREELGPEIAAVLELTLNSQQVPDNVRIDYHAASMLEICTVEQAQEALERVASNHATVIEQPASPRRVINETARAVEMFRPTRKGGR